MLCVLTSRLESLQQLEGHLADRRARLAGAKELRSIVLIGEDPAF